MNSSEITSVSNPVPSIHTEEADSQIKLFQWQMKRKKLIMCSKSDIRSCLRETPHLDWVEHLHLQTRTKTVNQDWKSSETTFRPTVTVPANKSMFLKRFANVSIKLWKLYFWMFSEHPKCSIFTCFQNNFYWLYKHYGIIMGTQKNADP